MLRHLGRFLFHFRWPLMAGVFVFLALVYVLQPRPMAEYTIPPKQGQKAFSYEQMTISPSGRFALLFDDLPKNISLIDLTSCHPIFERGIKDWSECRFDDEDGLVFADYGDNDKTIECWRWLPGTNTPTKMFERPSFLPGIHFGESQHNSWFQGSIAKLEDGIALNSFLSPDAHTWLIPVRVQYSFRFELVDARTGQLKSKLEPPLKQPDMEAKPVCEVAFSADSKQIIIQYPLPNEFKSDETYTFALEVHSAETGKRVMHKLLPYKTKLEQLVQFDDKHILAVAKESDFYFLQHLSQERGYQYSLMKEMISDPMEQSRDAKDLEVVDKISAELCPIIGASDGMIVYCWQKQSWPKGVGAGRPAYAPGFYYACRKIETGQLVHTECLPLRKRGAQDLYPEGWQLLGILPKHILLLKEPYDGSPEERIFGEPAQWKQTLESWREKYGSWLPSLLNNDSHLVCINAANGKRMDRLSVPINRQLIAYHVPQQQSLYFGFQQEDDFHILQYAYPFRKPWLLIFTWSLGMFAALACLQVLLQQIKRMLKRKPVS